MDMLGTWIAAIFTLILFSFLYKDNPLYRMAENIFVGISTGYYIAVVWQSIIRPNVVVPVLDGHYAALIPGMLGVVLLLQLVPNLSWLARYPIALYIGVGAALNMIQYTQGQLIPQIQGTMLAPVLFDKSGNFMAAQSITNVLIIVGTMCSLAYFFFALENKHLAKVSRIGIGFLMVSFGAAYGTTVMGRISLLISRFDFLINDWVKPWFN